MAYLAKDATTILQGALQKLQTQTPITATSPGSVARALAEVITQEIGDLYSVIDFNMSLNVVSTAGGTALDYIGAFYNVQRKALTQIATIDQSLGVFYFYVDAPFNQTITVPAGTRIYTDATTYVGQQFVYITTLDVTIPSGRTRTYASIRPYFADSVFTAGTGTLTVIDPNFVQPNGIVLKCTNPKPIIAQVGYENDDAYRSRILAQVRTSAGGTWDAVRNAGLQVAGVRDITIITGAFGMGSFQAIVVPEDNVIASSIVSNALTVMASVKPLGVRMIVTQPTVLPLSLDASIVIRPNTNYDAGTILQRVQTSIIRYLNTFLVGSQFVYTQLVQAILDANEAISDVIFTSLSVNGAQILKQNYTPDSDQQIIPGEVTVSVANT